MGKRVCVCLCIGKGVSPNAHYFLACSVKVFASYVGCKKQNVPMREPLYFVS